MRLEIRDLQRELGVTSLYVTHDQVEAMTLADRMIVMNDGRAEQIGAPLTVYKDPQTAFVAGFIGSPPINFLSGAAGAPEGGKLGIRPEHLSMRPDAPMLTGALHYAEPLGAETLIHLRLPDGQALILRQDGAAPIPAAGETVGVAWDTAAELRFDKTGRRV